MLALFLLLIVFVGLGILSIIISLPLIDEKVKPNMFYGFRVRATLENPKVWYAVNKYFGRRLLLTGVVQIVAAIGLYAIPDISIDAYVTGALGIFAITFTLGMIQSFRYLKFIRPEGNDRTEPRV